MNKDQEYSLGNWSNRYLFPISKGLYLADPLTSNKSMRLLEESIDLIYNVGLEGINFHMIAERLEVPLSFIQRYFQDKYQLTAYLNEFYWYWLSHWISRYQLKTTSVKHRLIISIQCLCHEYSPLKSVQEPFINPLFTILIREPLKQEPFFLPDLTYSGFNWGFKKLTLIFRDTIEELNPGYPYAENLALVLLEAYKQHVYASKYIPEWTSGDSLHHPRYSNFLIDLAMSILIEK